ncbi:MAG: S8 family serine peptidase [Oscillospiraceae bacterium]|nr:S8 family serine peptidase [Oscillospiraceae bacterium]
MNRTWRRILSLLLATVMTVSLLPAAGFAVGGASARTTGRELEMEDLDPSTLKVKKLGTGEDAAEEAGEIKIDPDDTVRVSIFLDKKATLDAGYSAQSVATDSGAIAYRDSLKRQQAAVTASAEKALGHTLDVKWNLTLLVNAISANVKFKEIVKIGTIPGVKSVELESRYEPQADEIKTANTSVGMVGAQAAWAGGYTGAGSRIAIIDTGLDTTHQSFDADAFSYAISQLENAPALMTAGDIPGGLNGSGTYLNAKIPYAYNYVDGNTTVNHLNDTEGEHGSHVAGIAAANRFIKSGSSYVEAIDSVHAVGMAPDAQLLIMKVFGASGGAYDSDYFAAIEDAVALKCDAANLSLGSGAPGWTFANSYQTLLNNLAASEDIGMVLSISAGNSGAFTEALNTDLYIDDVGMHTGGSPGSFINSLGVAAAENIGATGAPLKVGGRSIFYTETPVEQTSRGLFASIPGTYDFVYIDAKGTASDYSAVNGAVSLSGKVVIVNRGELSFVEKGNNATSYSPKAILIANNDVGTIAMDLTNYTGTAPMASITLVDANFIKENGTSAEAGGVTYYTGSITVTDTIEHGLVSAREDAEVASFSSWGVPGSLLMKPEITAPGGNIYSVFGTNKTSSGTAGGSDQYEMMSGTSMAAPHITGLSAIVGQYLRETGLSVEGYSTRAVMQSLLMSTATPMISDDAYVSILQQGAGLADVSKAITAPSVVMVSNAGLTTATKADADGKVKVEFGDVPARVGVYT